MWQKAKNEYHLGQAIIANLLYGFPARKMKVIGVTGTDGKTTTASLIYHILENAGYKSALISTIGAVINDKSSDIGYHVTTPGRFALQLYLKKARTLGVEYVVLEITSHALDQYRAFGIPIEVGVLTNISNEHLDYHKTYEKYVAAKAKLLKAAKVAVVNKDDRSYPRIMNYELGIRGKKVVTYGMGEDADLNMQKFPFKSKLIGKFNDYNCLAAIAAVRELQIPDSVIRDGISSFEAPIGRQDVIHNKDFMVINDFAHTPNSFFSVLPEIKKLAKNKLIHVFGAAGDRDHYKRPEMGKVSSDNADVIVLTAEDPRNENIADINNQILSGIEDPKFGIINYEALKNNEVSLNKNNKYIILIPDRKEAIEFAISYAQTGDVVLLTGKGHEKSMNYGKGEEAWNEQKIALDAIQARIK